MPSGSRTITITVTSPQESRNHVTTAAQEAALTPALPGKGPTKLLFYFFMSLSPIPAHIRGF